uniref:Putative LAGLIDADG homing endonuclease n=1 Tax=Pleurastrosarcina brevispinosa TaxID=163096 RepID=A0A097KN86_9CHLO|nr:putative LAGLIDADG homing endonuclease [Chlorosarcina brevispinosa]
MKKKLVKIKQCMEKNSETGWNQWLAGIIDGDGYLAISKDGYAYLEITMDINDEIALSQIKRKLGGTVTPRSGSKSIRFRIKNKAGMVNCINCINGEIRNSIRIEQFQKVCHHLQIPYIPAKPLTLDNGYTAGLFDADGTITICVNKSSAKDSIRSGIEGKIARLCYSRDYHQLTLKITNKYKENVSIFKHLFEIGEICCDNSRKTGPIYHWYFRSYSDVFQFLQYLKKHPLRSAKKNRLFLLNLYFSLKKRKAHLADYESIQFKNWKNFCKKWFSIVEN